MEIGSLPGPLRKLVNEELAAGERVRWVGQPIPHAGALRWVSLVPMVMGVPIICFMIFWMGSAAGVFDRADRADRDDHAFRLIGYTFALLGLPGLAFGLAFLLAPVWMPWRVRVAARRTAYVITDKRAIIFDGGYAGDRGLPSLMVGMVRPRGKGTTIRSYPPEKLTHVERTQRDDGSGDVIFHEEEVPAGEAGEQPTFVQEGLFSVPRVKEVEELVRALAKTAKGA